MMGMMRKDKNHGMAVIKKAGGMLLTLRRLARRGGVSLLLLLSLLTACLTTPMLYSCARMGAPDGGWYDETPPRVVGAIPAEKSTHVDKRHIRINFNEFVKIDNPTQNVVVSPPQLEVPEIKGEGKSISVKLIDKLHSCGALYRPFRFGFQAKTHASRVAY